MLGNWKVKVRRWICFLDKISKIFENKNKRTVNWHQQWMILLTCKCGSQIDQSLDKSEINEEIWFSSCKVSRFLNICYGDCDVRRSETVTRRIAFFPLPLIFLSSMIDLALYENITECLFSLPAAGPSWDVVFLDRQKRDCKYLGEIKIAFITIFIFQF